MAQQYQTRKRKGTPMNVRALVACSAVFLITGDLRAQDASRLVGTWERIYLQQTDGVDIQPRIPVPHLIFTPDGFHSFTSIPAARDGAKKPLQTMSKEELIARFDGLAAFWGTYTVTGNKLTRRATVHSDPNLEGHDYVSEFRFDGDDLILLAVDSKN